LLGKACADEDLEMICLPGATAFVPALVVSGLPNHDFYFAGFFLKKRQTNQTETTRRREKNHRFVRKST
jgi:16S rRNA (cytidine1402-2'-O)-methyltransferase